MSNLKYAWGEIVSFGSVRVGSLRERLIQFYRLMGSQPGRVTIYTPDQIAQVIGIEGTAKETAARKIHKARSALVKAGILERVEDPDNLSQDDKPMYSWRTVDPELDEDAFEILNRKAPAWREFIAKGEQAYWMAKSMIEEVPTVALFTYKGNVPAWHQVFPNLVDFTDPSIITLWTEKIPRAINSRKHPLAYRQDRVGRLLGIQDPDLRLQVTLTGVDRLFQDRLEGNPRWFKTIESPMGFLLATLGKVGSKKHPECEPNINDKQMAEFMETSKDITLARVAKKALRSMLPDRIKQEMLAAKKKGNVVPITKPEKAAEGNDKDETEQDLQDIASNL